MINCTFLDNALCTSFICSVQLQGAVFPSFKNCGGQNFRLYIINIIASVTEDYCFVWCSVHWPAECKQTVTKCTTNSAVKTWLRIIVWCYDWVFLPSVLVNVGREWWRERWRVWAVTPVCCRTPPVPLGPNPAAKRPAWSNAATSSARPSGSSQPGNR